MSDASHIDTIMRWLLKAKPWHLWLALLGLPVALLLLDFTLFSAKEVEAIFVYGMVIALLWINAVGLAWIGSIGTLLQSHKAGVQRNDILFKLAIAHNVISLLLFLAIAPPFLLGHPLPYLDVVSSVIWPVWPVSSIYAARYAARTVVEAERGERVRWIDVDTLFILNPSMWQPRINAVLRRAAYEQ